MRIVNANMTGNVTVSGRGIDRTWTVSGDVGPVVGGVKVPDGDIEQIRFALGANSLDVPVAGELTVWLETRQPDT